MAKGEATRSLPSLKDTASQQRQQQGMPVLSMFLPLLILRLVTRGRSPLAQANTSGPAASPVSSPKPSGFKAFLRKTFGIGKGSGDKQKKDKSPSASPSSRTQNQRPPLPRSASPATPTQSANPTPFAKACVSRSPPAPLPALATPVFSPSSPTSSPSTSAPLQPSLSNLAPPLPEDPSQIPLPPSPLVPQDSPQIPTSAGFSAGPPVELTMPTRLSAESQNTVPFEGTTNIAATETRTSAAERSSSEATRVNAGGRSSDTDEDAKPKLEPRASPGRAGSRASPSKIMSAIEPQQPNPFGMSPVDTSHINAGMASTGAAHLLGGVTMSRSVTAEGMQEAEEIMDEKRLVLEEASKKLVASIAARPKHADDEEEEAKDSFASDLGVHPRALARKVSPTSTNGIPKYGRSTSAPAGDRLSVNPGFASRQDRFGRKASVKEARGSGLTRSGSKLRTSVYGLADVSKAFNPEDHHLTSFCSRFCTERRRSRSRSEFQLRRPCIRWTPLGDRPTRSAIRRKGTVPRVSSCHKAEARQSTKARDDNHSYQHAYDCSNIDTIS